MLGVALWAWSMRGRNAASLPILWRTPGVRVVAVDADGAVLGAVPRDYEHKAVLVDRKTGRIESSLQADVDPNEVALLTGGGFAWFSRRYYGRPGMMWRRGEGVTTFRHADRPRSGLLSGLRSDGPLLKWRRSYAPLDNDPPPPEYYEFDLRTGRRWSREAEPEELSRQPQPRSGLVRPTHLPGGAFITRDRLVGDLIVAEWTRKSGFGGRRFGRRTWESGVTVFRRHEEVLRPVGIVCDRRTNFYLFGKVLKSWPPNPVGTVVLDPAGDRIYVCGRDGTTAYSVR